MADIFISYAREDHGIAQKVAEALSTIKCSVWWDRDIIAGQEFDEVIERELDLAKCVIVLWSNYSVSSRWVRNEATSAAERGVLVPALIEKVKLPLAFRGTHTVDLTRWDGDPDNTEFRSIRRAVEAHLSQGENLRMPETHDRNLKVPDTGVRFEDFVVQFDASSRGFRVRVLRSPFGEGTTGFSLPSFGETESPSDGVAGAQWAIDHQADVLSARPPLEIGTALYHTVFQGQVRSLFDKSRAQLEISPNLGLRLKIKIDPIDEETGALADLPWELLCDEQEDFLALSRQTSLVRYLEVPRSSNPIPFTPPLRILVVGASPGTMAPLDLEEETRRLEELSRNASGTEVRFLFNASAGAVREALAGDTYNVLHFMGNCVFDQTSGEGMLAFESVDGLPDLVSGKTFAAKLRDLRSLGVVVLNACNTARASYQGGANPFRGVATALVLGGVPAVVAMQRPMTDRAAVDFNAAFYRHLARGDSIDEALTEGRQAIHSANPAGFEWAAPVLFLRIPSGNVFVVKS